LLSLELHISDCTIVKREMELFGPKNPLVGAEQGTPLNNFLARKNGQKAIVFLDEFDRSSPEIWDALLIPFDRGNGKCPACILH
jgi:ATP-dependent Clp protease ATP-binding subunit ClpA